MTTMLMNVSIIMLMKINKIITKICSKQSTNNRFSTDCCSTIQSTHESNDTINKRSNDTINKHPMVQSINDPMIQSTNVPTQVKVLV